jgi:phage terminase small subunit
MGILKNRFLEIFAQGLARGMPMYEAAKQAGYNADRPSFENNARKRASKPEVRARIKELQERAAEKVTIDLAWILERLAHVAGIALDPKEIKAGDALRALDMIVKIKGYYAPEKREILARLTEASAGELDALEQTLAAAEQRRAEQRSESERVH